MNYMDLLPGFVDLILDSNAHVLAVSWGNGFLKTSFTKQHYLGLFFPLEYSFCRVHDRLSI